MTIPSSIKGNQNLTILYLLFLCQQFPVIAVILSKTKLRDFLSLAQLHIRDYHICRSALVNHDASSFQMLCKSGNNQSLIFLGLDYHSLNYLLRKFTQLSSSSARATAVARRVRSQAITLQESAEWVYN